MIKFLPLILAGVFIGVLAYWLVIFLRTKYTHDGSPLSFGERLFAVFLNSATIVSARLTAMLSVVVGVLVNWAGDPSVQDWMRSALNPKYSWAYLLGFMIIQELSRYRTLEKDD